MASEADTGQVQAAAGTYAERLNYCGCRSVPKGQHLPGCRNYDTFKNRQAKYCSACGFHTATERGRCGLCGATKR